MRRTIRLSRLIINAKIPGHTFGVFDGINSGL
jgi:hypothetical protein